MGFVSTVDGRPNIDTNMAGGSLMLGTGAGLLSTAKMPAGTSIAER